MLSSPSNYALSPEDVRIPATAHNHTIPPLERNDGNSGRYHVNKPVRELKQMSPQTRESGGGTLDLAGLKHQVDLLSAEIAAFTVERDALKTMLSEARSATELQPQVRESLPSPSARTIVDPLIRTSCTG